MAVKVIDYWGDRYKVLKHVHNPAKDQDFCRANCDLYKYCMNTDADLCPDLAGDRDHYFVRIEKTEIEAGKFYMCLEDIGGYESFTKGKVYHSLYHDALVNDNHIEVKVEPSYKFRIATDAEVAKAKRKED